MSRAMYERHFGPKYAETAHLGHDYAALAKLVRADIKEAVKLGVLPGKATDYRVRSESYSGGGSINVRLVNHAHLWMTCEGKVPGSESEDGRTATACGHPFCSDGHQVLTVEGQAVRKTMTWLLQRYNYDGSESQVDYFDVRYYGQADILDAESMRFFEAEQARLAKNKEEAAAKKEVIAKLVPHGYKAGRLRTASLERLEALLAKVEAR